MSVCGDTRIAIRGDSTGDGQLPPGKLHLHRRTPASTASQIPLTATTRSSVRPRYTTSRIVRGDDTATASTTA
jgi:hypothetical protein